MSIASRATAIIMAYLMSGATVMMWLCHRSASICDASSAAIVAQMCGLTGMNGLRERPQLALTILMRAAHRASGKLRPKIIVTDRKEPEAGVGHPRISRSSDIFLRPETRAAEI